MANEPISALTLFTSYSTADEVEILDVSDTTFASTGTNKRIPFSTLLTMAGVATAAGVTTVAGGGTGLTAVGSADQLLGVTHTGGALEYKTLTAGSNVTITPAAGSITIAASGGGGGSGTVTSVGLSLPPFITVTGSPVSTSGTLTEPSPPRRPIPTSLARPVAQQQLQRSAPLCRRISQSSSHPAQAMLLVPFRIRAARQAQRDYLREDATWDVPPSSGLTTGGAVTGGAANAILYENSSSNLAASAALTFNGTNTVSTTATSLILQQTGDSGGTSYLQLCNRNASNGAIFKNSAIQLVDFAFQDSAGNQNNLRSGSGSTFTHGYGNTSGEFDFIVNILGSGVAVLYMGGSTSQFYGAGTGRISNNVAFGTQPAGALHVVSAATNAPGLVVDGLASQTSDLAEFRNSTPTVLSRVTAAGEINGPIAPIYAALTGTATATAQQCLIAVSAASAGWTLTLPAANAVQAGHEYLIKKTDNNSNAITVTAAGSDTIMAQQRMFFTPNGHTFVLTQMADHQETG